MENRKKINGVIHNPHYFDYLKNNGKNIQNTLDCNMILDHNIISLIMRTNRPLALITRSILHIQEVILPIYTTNILKDNLDIRIKFIMNEITEDEFKIKLQRREKSKKNKYEIYNVLNMLIISFTDIIFRYNSDIQNNFENVYNKCYSYLENTNKKYENEVDYLKEYVNELFVDISKTYKTKELKLDEKFIL